MLAHQFGYNSLFLFPSLLFLFELGAYEWGSLKQGEEDWKETEANRIQS